MKVPEDKSRSDPDHDHIRPCFLYAQVKLINLDTAALMAERGEVERQSGGPAPSRLLRRPHGHQEHQGRPAGHDARTASQSIKEREEDYHRARERIIGGAEQGSGGVVPAEVVQSSSPAGSGSGSGANHGHSGGPGGYMAGRGGGRDGGGGGRGRGRKAVFRDKDREMQDPDYTRRDGGSSYGIDGMGYGMEVRGMCLVLGNV